MHKAHSIRLNPTPSQAQAFMRAAGVARFAYNFALAEYQRKAVLASPTTSFSCTRAD